MLLTVLYILKDEAGEVIGAELQHNGKNIRSTTEEIKRKRKGISFLNATVDAEGLLHSKDVTKPLREKVTDWSGPKKHKGDRPAKVSVKLK